MNHTDEIDDEWLEKLLQVSVCTAAHTLVEMGWRNQYLTGIMPLAFPEGKKRAAGRAVTLRFIPLREDLVEKQYGSLTSSPHRTALESIKKNDVLVIDTGAHMETGVIGDIFTRRLRYLGGQGIVVDGCVRDLERIKLVDFPVLARGVHGGAIPRTLMSAGWNEPIRCGGVAVIPGDIILCDRDGAVAIPPQCVEELIRRCTIHDDEEEAWIRMKLDEGGSLHKYYPPNEEARKEYESWKQSNQAAGEGETAS